MSRQLIAFVDRAPEGNHPGSDAPHTAPSPLAAWPSLDHARTGGFQRIILIADMRFRWDEVLAHVPDRAFEEPAPPPPEPEPKPAESPAEAEPAAAIEAPPAEALPAETAASEPAAEDEAVETPAADASVEAPAADAASEPSAEPATEPAEPEASGEAAIPAVEHAAPDRKPAKPKQPPRPREPKRLAPKSVAELRERLHHMAQTGHADRAATDRLCSELARELGAGTVSVRVMPPFARDREQVSMLRSVLGVLEAHLPAVLDFADGPRMAAGLGLTLAHGLASLRPDVPVAELTMDRSRNLGFHPRSLLHAIEVQELWREVFRGGTPSLLVEHMRADNRLQGLAAPYQRFARALEFGNPAEAARAARTVQQRLAELAGKGAPGDDWVAAVRPALDAMTGSLLKDEPWSRRQLWMAESAAKRGMHFLAALHVREALVSGLLETYGQNAARGWTAMGPDERAEARIRPRDVMAVVLADPESARIVPDLGEVWKWIGSPRSRFLMTSPVTVDPALLRDGSHALLNVPVLARAILDDNRMKAIVDVLPWEEAIKLALDKNAVRVAPVRGRRGPRRGAPGEGAGPMGADGQGGPAPEGTAPPDGAAPGAEAPHGAAPSAPPRPPRPRGTRFESRPRRGPRREDRGPGPRFGPGPGPGPGPDRPREITAHGGPDRPRGPRRDDRGPESHPGSVPVGGTIEVGRATSGLGNLGFALKNAGLNPTARGPKERPPRRDHDEPRKDEAQASKPAHEPHAAPEPQPPPEASAPPPRSEPAPAATPAPPPPAPDFDVAGPA